MNTYLEDFISLIYPHSCISCGDLLPKGRSDICPTCVYNLPKTKNHIIPVPQFIQKFEGIVKIDKVYVYSYFQKHGIVQKILHELKYNDNEGIGITFGRYFGNDLMTEASLPSFDFIIPVPLHPKKLKLRGYNQSEMLAKGMAQALKVPLNIELLYRKKHFKTQTKRNKIERINIMSETFAVLDISMLGRHLLLVDDVLTTGATLIACVEQLLKLKPASISIAVLAGVK